MPKRDGTGEAKAHTKGGKEEAKGGESMKINREDVVQAALMVERWCKEHIVEDMKCDCPFHKRSKKVFQIDCPRNYCALKVDLPSEWNLEEHLRTRGIQHDD